MKINKENYEMFLMQYADNELDSNEVKELLSFIEKHPEANEALLAFKNLRINVDKNDSFENKEQLYKKTSVISYFKYALPFAASLLLVIFLWQQNVNTNAEKNVSPKVVLKDNKTTQAVKKKLENWNPLKKKKN